MTLAVFSRFGTIPDEKERLNRYNRGSEISSLIALNNFVYLVFTYRKTIHTIFKWWRQIIFKVITVIPIKFVLTTKTDRAKIIIKVITYCVRILNIIITNMQLLYIISTFIFTQ